MELPFGYIIWVPLGRTYYCSMGEHPNSKQTRYAEGLYSVAPAPLFAFRRSRSRKRRLACCCKSSTSQAHRSASCFLFFTSSSSSPPCEDTQSTSLSAVLAFPSRTSPVPPARLQAYRPRRPARSTYDLGAGSRGLATEMATHASFYCRQRCRRRF